MRAPVVLSTVSHLRPALLAVLVSGSMLAACSGSSEPSGPKAITYFGVLASSKGVHSGTVTLRILDDNSGGSGSFTVDGSNFTIASLQVNGTQVTGSGGGYSFDGVVSANDVSGTWDTGVDQGIFTLVLKAGGQTAVAYCGSHIGTLNGGQPTGGAFMVVKNGATLRGVITSAGSPAVQSLITGSGTDVLPEADMNVGANTFDATYSDVVGDAGEAAGRLCGNAGPTAGPFIGVIGDFPGTSLGTIGLNLGNSSVTSSGTFSVNGTPTALDAVIVGVSNKVVAFSGDQVFSGTISGSSLDGEWWVLNNQTGLMAAIEDQGNVVLYCGTQNSQTPGTFSFALIGGDALHGLFTGGVGNAFQGLIGGAQGNNAGTMSGQAGPATVLPDPTTFGGFFDFSAGGGANGSVSGVVCP